MLLIGHLQSVRASRFSGGAAPIGVMRKNGHMEHSDQNIRDAEAILSVVKAVAPLWNERQTACRKIVRCALDEFWEAPRVSQGKRRDPKALWSPTALTAGMAAQREDRHTGGRSVMWDKLAIVPLLPMTDQAAELVEIANSDAPIDAVIAVAEGTAVILTQTELQGLRDKGFSENMPEGWAWGDDIWARFREHDLGPEAFKAWAGLSADPFAKIQASNA